MHDKIILYCINFRKHIRQSHPEISLNKIEAILKEPEYIYKPAANSKTFYYERKFGKNLYRVVIDKHDKNIKKVATAYKVNNKNKFTRKHTFCVYDYQENMEYEKQQKELEEDMNYFYQLFGIIE